AAALEWARKAAEPVPADVGMQAHLANAHMQIGDLDAARAVATQGLVLNPRAAQLLRLLSIVEQRGGNDAAALEWAHKAAEAAPDDAGMQAHLANAHMQIGDLDAARAVATQGLALNPRAAQLLRLLSIVEQRGGNDAAALEWARKAAEAAPADAGIGAHLANLYLQRGDLVAARA
ncbi:hypothetical protein D9599_30500, partial [Roseomonas sp. KE2513]|uniref:tetratricopeptide repeat protein n=1 Tax=Roseomonas sp. KE2513 TaxID=2479202 RepID=UPI0018DFA0D9